MTGNRCLFDLPLKTYVRQKQERFSSRETAPVFVCVSPKALAASIQYRQEVKAMSAEMFIATVRKYTRAKKLTERMLNELIARIEVHQASKVDGINRQRLTIHYNCVGAIELPDTLTLPEIIMQTRKGVTVGHAPLHQAS